nr:EAL domain-containing protein [Psychrosphaera haliotis]
MASDIKLAMRSGEMFVKYQPQFDIDSGEIVTFEALLRWRHPELGNLNPLEVITVAEDTGLIEEVTIWLIEASCRNFSRFYSADKSNELCIAINMSTQVILSPSFSQRVMDIIENHKLKASQFLLEITERSFKSDSQQLEHKIRKLRALGFKIAIDDFGTGSASLTYLNKGIFNALKIPKNSFNLCQAMSVAKAL